MKILIIEQTNKNGHKKSWRITPHESPSVFGSSRTAQLISQDPLALPFEGVFEFHNEEWNFYDMHPERFNNSLSCTLNETHLLKFPESEIKVTCFEKKDSLSESLQRTALIPSTHSDNQETQPFQLFVVRFGEKVLETQIVSLKKEFKSHTILGNPTVKPLQTPEWQKQTIGEYEVSQKTVYLQNQNEINSIPNGELIDKESRRSLVAIVISSFLLITVAILSPKTKSEFAPPSIPKVAQKVVFKNETFRKKVPPPEPKPVEKTQPVVRQVASIQESSSPAGGGSAKVSHLIKSIQQGRLSTLLGKVSAQAARSKNIIVSGGVKAGQAPSGPALSALGPVDKSGRDWASDAKGAGLTINTAGKGGGKSTSGLGTLSGGKVGSGGVGLIEDESEIVGGLDREIIAQYIKTQLGQILYCYERQLSAQPELFGKVAIKFEIGPTGQVSKQAIGDTTLKNATVEGCILNKVATWKFPTPQGGTKVLVTYPFLFKSTN